MTRSLTVAFLPHDMFKEDWDDGAYPQAYLLTFRTYGTWLHGDQRGSVDSHYGKNIYGSPEIAANLKLEKMMREKMKRAPFLLDSVQRKAVGEAVVEYCKYKNHLLHASNVRTNHVHVVVAAQTKPEIIINSMKGYATRKLRDLHLISNQFSPWSRGGSRRYLWKERHVALAIEYVLYAQGDIPFEISE